jgi:pyruvate formate lyase activating enzyme
LRAGEDITGMVVNIQRNSVHDGKGLRTTVFLKGCNMRCYWCHNPETFSGKPQLRYDEKLCIGCGECLNTCINNAHISNDGRHIIDAMKCGLCGKCAEVCFSGALDIIGKKMSVRQVMAEIMEDEIFYKRSAGGVTISGGEPLLQPEFTKEILMQCRRKGIHTAIESNVSLKWSSIESIVREADLVIADIKTMNESEHKSATGISNSNVLENIKKIDGIGKEIIIRTPVIPGFNAEKKYIAEIANFLNNINGLRYYELLPYHPLGKDKEKTIVGLEPSQDIAVPNRELMVSLAQSACEYGVEVWIASKKYRCQRI